MDSDRRIFKLRRSDIEFARQYLEPGMRSVFSYILKRNIEYGIDTCIIDPAEEYAVLRQTMSKHEIERMLNIEIIVKGGKKLAKCNVCKDSKIITKDVQSAVGTCKQLEQCPYCKDKK